MEQQEKKEKENGRRTNKGSGQRGELGGESNKKTREKGKGIEYQERVT